MVLVRITKLRTRETRYEDTKIRRIVSLFVRFPPQSRLSGPKTSCSALIIRNCYVRYDKSPSLECRVEIIASVQSTAKARPRAKWTNGSSNGPLKRSTNIFANLHCNFSIDRSFSQDNRKILLNKEKKTCTTYSSFHILKSLISVLPSRIKHI